jgi:hypothetical protein
MARWSLGLALSGHRLMAMLLLERQSVTLVDAMLVFASELRYNTL